MKLVVTTEDETARWVVEDARGQEIVHYFLGGHNFTIVGQRTDPGTWQTVERTMHYNSAQIVSLEVDPPL